MVEYLGDVAVVATAIVLCSTILRHILLRRQNDNQAVDERMQTEGDEQDYTCDAEDQSVGERALFEEQKEEDNNDDNESHNAGRQPSGVATTASDYLRTNCGYYFQDGKLVDTESGKGFIFKGQQDYEELGLVMNEYIYELLERDGDLEMKMLGMYDGKPRGFCFASKDVDTNTNGMLVLIHGTGVVRAGQWSRRLIINHSLESGSQMPYIQEAKKRNWSVVVMNTNQRSDYYQWINGGAFFMGFDPEDHGVAVWKTIIEGSPAKRIAIVAHSYGGSVTSCLLREMGGHFKEKVVAIALTDSWCSVQSSDQQYFKKVAKNWVTSKYPVGHSVGYGHDCEHVSAGTTVHEETSWKSIENVFEFIDKKFQASQSNAKTFVYSTSQYSKGQEIETVKQPVYQQDTRDDFNTQARNETRAENVADALLASPSGSSEDIANVKAAEQATGDSSIQSTANYADKNELDNVAKSSLPCIDVPDVDTCELQQRGASVEERNTLTSIFADAATAGDIVAAGEHDTNVAGHATEISDTRPFLSEMTKENRDTVSETHRSVADISNTSTSHPVEDVSLVQSETDNQKFALAAAHVDNEGKSEAAKPTDRNFDRSFVISDNNMSANDSSDQTLVDLTEYPLSGATVSILSQQQLPSPLGESHLKQSLTEASDPATANNTSTSVMLTAEPTGESNDKMRAIVENSGIDLPERTIGTELATAGESSTYQRSISQHAADTVSGQAVTDQSGGKAVRETVNDDAKV